MAKKDYLLAAEAAKVLEIDVKYIRDLAAKDAIPHETRGDSLFVDVRYLNDYLNRQEEIKNARKPNRTEEMKDKVQQTNSLVRAIGLLFSDIIDSIAELGSLIPLAEIIVTIAAFYGAGLGEIYGLEVLIGLVFAQIAALHLTAHYRDIAMHWLGETAIFVSVIVGAVNTGIAVYLALSGREGATVADWVWLVPAFSAGTAVLLMYLAKLFTHERVQARTQRRRESEEEMKELKRQAKADRERAATKDKMQQTQLDMEADALEELAEDPRIKAIQKKAMWLTVVNNIMAQYDIQPRSKLGQELLDLANEGLDVDVDADVPEPDFLPNGRRRQPATNGSGH